MTPNCKLPQKSLGKNKIRFQSGCGRFLRPGTMHSGTCSNRVRSSAALCPFKHYYLRTVRTGQRADQRDLQWLLPPGGPQHRWKQPLSSDWLRVRSLHQPWSWSAGVCTLSSWQTAACVCPESRTLLVQRQLWGHVTPDINVVHLASTVTELNTVNGFR